jgi:hypothetical protein
MFWVAMIALCALAGSVHAQSTNDLRSVQSGNWSAQSTWQRYDGSDWVALGANLTINGAAATAPNVTVRSGHTVYLNDTPFAVRNLTIETGGRVYAGLGTNHYITIYGTTLQCDGEIGSGATFDQISFNIDGANVTIQGSGIFNASRLRKNFNANTTTNLTIAMNINLWFNTSSSAQIYNNYDGTVNFNVTINSGVTVNINDNGNISMDGIDGASTHARGGSYTVNGTLNVSGIIYMTTNNVNAANRVQFTINSGGVVRAARVNVNNSGNAGHVLAINSGGSLELTGTGASWVSFSLPSTNNTYTLDAGSTVTYSAAGVQNVIPMPGGYGNLTIRGTGDKQLSAATIVKGSVSILNADGSPVLDVMPDNWQLNVGGNWTSYGQAGFNERSGLVIFDLGTAQAVNTNSGERFYNWRIGKSGSQYVSLNSGVTVVNNLNHASTNGRLDLNGQQLTILNGATGAITGTFGTTRHIRSERTDNTSRVQWNIGSNLGSHTIPFGSNSGIRSFTFNLTSGNAGNVTVSTYGTAADNLPWPTSPVVVNNLEGPLGLTPDNRDATVDRFWQVEVTGTPTATLTFRYTAAELPASPYDTPTAMHAQRYDGATDTWQDPIESQSSGSYNVQVPGVTEFGPWAITAVTSPLPIELLAFDAESRTSVVDLFWSTASERNNAYFTVERSADGFRFIDLFRVDGGIDSQVRRDYQAVDDAPLDGLSYYRLRQTDMDGNYSHSEVVAIHRDVAGNTILVYPNPADDHLMLVDTDLQGAQVRIVDLAGRVVWAQQGGMEADRVRIPLDGVAPGLYHVMVEQGGIVRSAPFVRR